MSLLNYVPYVLSCSTCLVPYLFWCPTSSRALRASVHTCSTCPVPYVLWCPPCLVLYALFVSYMLLCPTCPTSSGALRALVLHTIRAIVPCVHRTLCALMPHVLSCHTWSCASCLTCFPITLVLRALVPHLSYMFLNLTCLLSCIFLGCS